eukprot:1848225-Rhodomonas_salina.2
MSAMPEASTLASDSPHVVVGEQGQEQGRVGPVPCRALCYHRRFLRRGSEQRPPRAARIRSRLSDDAEDGISAAASADGTQLHEFGVKRPEQAADSDREPIVQVDVDGEAEGHDVGSLRAGVRLSDGSCEGGLDDEQRKRAVDDAEAGRWLGAHLTVAMEGCDAVVGDDDQDRHVGWSLSQRGVEEAEGEGAFDASFEPERPNPHCQFAAVLSPLRALIE